MAGYAWVTLATNDAYSLGALVLAHSLRRVDTKYELAVLVTPGVTSMMREKLAAVFNLVQEVNVLDSKDEANLALLARPELGITFTKLHCWRLTQYEKCVFVDADTLVVRNCDELFEREELSAAHDIGWPDCFNSGVFVFRPSQQTFASITAFAAAKGSFDGGDQGLLNMYFHDWARKDISKHLPFIYNMCSTAAYSYLPAFKQFGEDVRIIHFIGITKPWLQYFDTLTGIVQPPSGMNHLQPLLQLWWNIFCDKVHPQLSPVMAGLAGALAQMTLGEPRSAEQIALEEHMRKQSWEQGQIDYMGRDSFDNIWKKICETLSSASRQPSPPKTTTQDEVKTDKTEETNITKKETDSVSKSEGSDDIKSPAKAETTSDLSVKQSLICNIPKDDISQKESIDTFEMLTKDESIDIDKQSSSVCEEVDSKESKEISEADAELCLTQTTKETDLPSLSSDQTMILKENLLIDPIQDVIVKEELNRKTVEEENVDIQTNVDKVEESTIEQDTKCSSVCASEIMLTNPVPIQVAESVLQAEPKESVSQDLKLITEEVISSTVAPLQESVVAFSETPVELTNRTQLCDSTLLVSSNEAANIISPNTTSTISQNGDTVVNGSTMKLDESDSLLTPSVLKQVVEEIQSPRVEESQPQKTEILSEQLSLTESSQIKQEERSENVETKKETEGQSTSTESKVEQPEDAQTIVEGAAAVVEKTLEPSSLESTPIECPIRPTRTKEISIPSTPTVTEPTPPTSPIDVGTQDVEGQGKTAKKTTKKVAKKASVESDSAERADTETTEKKTAKKVVKKVVKKPKESQEEGGECSSSTDKPKKTGKSTKKITKSSSSLETDTSIPETPPPDNSDVPVPPKRKVKTSTSNKPASTAPKSDTGS
ncbi:PREDICTED: neurofilament heavy polypeptide isoform X3 [Polistes canadensis]|uniref:neurofilament heavy polypeptide isoform X3 n=1 Tax=Polistes canadensis TaxID=91411 RepID=UPI000718B0D2|nr:PREDICTED: neurofilament heavy polypeptide isoform X3 [Polistes canadensis]